MSKARFAASILAALLLVPMTHVMAKAGENSGKSLAFPEPHVAGAPLAATVESVASRGTVTAGATLYGGFALSSASTVYILVRGPSLVSLGVTPSALDAPWVRLYNASNADLISTGGRPGFTTCLGDAATDRPVVDFYQNVRRAPVHSRDSCLAASLPAGAYTFSVTPSIAGTTSPPGVSSAPSAGEILFEVTLGATTTTSEPPNRAATLRLVGGTWTYTYTILSTFSDRYRFTRVETTPNSSGVYYAEGVDEFGGTVVGGYDPRLGMWAVLDQGTIIDQFFTFTFTGTNTVSGCYYQVNPPGSTNLSRCYSMNGVRSGSGEAPLARDGGEAQRAREAGEQPQPGRPDPDALQLYEALRSRLR